MKIKTKRKFTLKQILVSSFVILLVGTLGIVGFSSINTKTISPTEFKVGTINDNGVYAASTTSIYTNNYIECAGLTIEPDFEAAGTFRVFYYDEDKAFIESTATMSATDGVYSKGDTVPLAKYCRILITPEAPEGEKNFKISFLEPVKYAMNYKITVDRNQNPELEDLFVIDGTMKNKVYTGEIGSLLSSEASEGMGAIRKIKVIQISKLDLSYEDDQTEGIYNAYFLDAEGNIVSATSYNGNINVYQINVPESAVYFVCTYKLGNEFVINAGY